jgi:transcriptional regulator with XRE-family HTH domain
MLAIARERQGLTQAELASRLGKPQSFVSKYESGERRLDVMEFVFVCDALGVEASVLFNSILGEAYEYKRSHTISEPASK